MNIGITIGDMAGIGPEVILKALQEPLPAQFHPVIFGSIDALIREDRRLEERVEGYRPQRERFHRVEAFEAPTPDKITVVEVRPDLNLKRLPTGEHDARCAHVQLEALIGAINAVQQNKIAAIVTAPWTKELFDYIDKPVVGHTEILADRFDAPHSVMMLAGPRLRVALVTTHVPLQAVSELLSDEIIQDTVRTVVTDLRRLFGIQAPRIAVCALNPHAGEAGSMGTEEIETIRPALRELGNELDPQVELSGPYPADGLFAKFSRGGAPYDAVIAMYHDQGLIPLKMLHFGESANITLGLPVVRTSVDHGTAYDIAGQGVADAGSMRYALELAIEMSGRVGSRPPRR